MDYILDNHVSTCREDMDYTLCNYISTLHEDMDYIVNSYVSTCREDMDYILSSCIAVSHADSGDFYILDIPNNHSTAQNTDTVFFWLMIEESQDCI
jgi:hypothetical protein